jgi:ACT domain-containing protein
LRRYRGFFAETVQKSYEICYTVHRVPLAQLVCGGDVSRENRGAMKSMKAFITVMGRDTVGVVAKVAALCSTLNINIEDVTQSILQGMFAMIMLVDLSGCTVSHEEMRARFDALSKEMGMQINLTRQEVFDAMHTI